MGEGGVPDDIVLDIDVFFFDIDVWISILGRQRPSNWIYQTISYLLSTRFFSISTWRSDVDIEVHELRSWCASSSMSRTWKPSKKTLISNSRNCDNKRFNYDIITILVVTYWFALAGYCRASCLQWLNYWSWIWWQNGLSRWFCLSLPLGWW